MKTNIRISIIPIMNNNPYTTPVPQLESADASVSDSNEKTLGAIARVVFLAWERLRLVYVGILAAFTLLLTGSRFLEPRVLMLVVAGAIAANMCFFTGPIVETYIRWLGYDGIWLRRVMFAVGTLLTAVSAFFLLANEMIPNQN